jgi:hypothetical protein
LSATRTFDIQIIVVSEGAFTTVDMSGKLPYTNTLLMNTSLSLIIFILYQSNKSTLPLSLSNIFRGLLQKVKCKRVTNNSIKYLIILLTTLQWRTNNTTLYGPIILPSTAILVLTTTTLLFNLNIFSALIPSQLIQLFF